MRKYLLRSFLIFTLFISDLCADDRLEICMSVGEKISPQLMKELESYKITGISRESIIDPRRGKPVVTTTRSYRIENLNIVLIVTFLNEDEVSKISWSKLTNIEEISEAPWFESNKICFSDKYFKLYK